MFRSFPGIESSLTFSTRVLSYQSLSQNSKSSEVDIKIELYTILNNREYSGTPLQHKVSLFALPESDPRIGQI